MLDAFHGITENIRTVADLLFYDREALRYYVNIAAKFSTPTLNAIQKLAEPPKWDVTDILEFRGSPANELLKRGEEFGERFAAAVKTP